jgi:hypothetical protein
VAFEAEIEGQRNRALGVEPEVEVQCVLQASTHL